MSSIPQKSIGRKKSVSPEGTKSVKKRKEHGKLSPDMKKLKNLTMKRQQLYIPLKYMKQINTELNMIYKNALSLQENNRLVIMKLHTHSRDHLCETLEQLINEAEAKSVKSLVRQEGAFIQLVDEIKQGTDGITQVCDMILASGVSSDQTYAIKQHAVTVVMLCDTLNKTFQTKNVKAMSKGIQKLIKQSAPLSKLPPLYSPSN